MKTKPKYLLTAGGLLAVATAALAGPLQRADVPGDPAWVMHLDCDALRPTAVGKFLLSEMEKPENQAKLAVFQTLVSVDLRTQLHGVTVYNVGTAEPDGVAVVYADFDAGRLSTLAKAAKESESADYKSHVIYSWLDESKKAKKGGNPRTYASVAGNRVVFGQRHDRVARALDVLDGSTPSLAAAKTFPALNGAGRGTFIQAAARKLDLSSSDPGAQVFKLASQIALRVGESDNSIKATLVLEANDSEVAGQIASVGQGLLALLKLQTEKPEAVKLANALALKQDGGRVEVNLSLPSGDVLDLIKADAARKAARKAKQNE